MTEMSFLGSFDELLDKRLNKLLDLDPMLDTREGSIAFDMASAGAIADSETLYAMDIFKDLVFARTSTGEYLDRRVSEIGITRSPGAFAIGEVEVSGLVNTTIPAGTKFADAKRELVFESTQTIVTSAEGTATLPLISVDRGSKYNVPPNTVIQALGDFLEVLQATNPKMFVGGINQESDEALLARYSDKLTNPPVSGNASQYRQWAMEVNGVGGAKIERLWAGNGTVKVIIMNSDKRAPSANLINLVNDRLNDEDLVPIGASITTVGAIENPIGATASVNLNAGYTIEYAQQEYKNLMKKYIEDSAMVTDTLQYVRFNFLFANMKSVYNFRNLLINGSINDVELNINKIPVIGEVVFS